MIFARTDKINNAAWGEGYNQPAVANGQQQEYVPNFPIMRTMLAELAELTAEFETSLSPA